MFIRMELCDKTLPEFNESIKENSQLYTNNKLFFHCCENLFVKNGRNSHFYYRKSDTPATESKNL